MRNYKFNIESRKSIWRMVIIENKRLKFIPIWAKQMN
jgi:hypothetical protein